MKREYPRHPLVGVGGVVIHHGRVLLVRRGGEPLKGEWSIPGGLLELGEALEAGTRRELKEETGLDVRVLDLVEAFERIIPDDAGRARFHYVLVDYLCEPVGGDLRAGSDVRDVAWVRVEDFGRYQLNEKGRAVCEKALALYRRRG
jgi:ADP-ribose pyrophosphatase YjhB (NUDIX family)